MAETIAELNAKINIEATGAAKATQEAKGFTKELEAIVARLEAAKAALSASQQRFEAMGKTFQEASQEATQASIRIQALKDKGEDLKRQMGALTDETAGAAEELQRLKDEYEDVKDAIAQEEAAHGDVIDAVNDHMKAVKNLTVTQKQHEMATKGVAGVYSSSVWEVRSYSRGISDFIHIVGSGNVTLDKMEGILGAAVYTAADFTKAVSEAHHKTGGWSGTLEILKAKLAGVNASTIALIGVVSLATIIFRALGARAQEERRNAELWTEALMDQTEAWEDNAEAIIRNTAAKKDDLQTLLDLGGSSEELFKIFQEGEEAVLAYTRALKEAADFGTGFDEKGFPTDEAEEYRDLILQIGSMWRSYAAGAADAAALTQDAWVSSVGTVMMELRDLSTAVLEGTSSNNRYVQSVFDIMNAELAMRGSAQAIIALITRRNQLEAERGKGTTLQERRDVEQQILQTEAAIEAAMVKAAEAGINLPEAVKAEFDRAVERGLVITQGDIRRMMPELDEMKAETDASAQEIAEGFRQGMIRQLIETAKTIDPELMNSVHAMAFALGVPIQRGIVAGTFGVKGALYSALDREIKQAMEWVRQNTLDSHSPSEVWAQLVGVPIGEGITQGAIEALAQLAPELDEAISAARAAVSFEQSKFGLVRAEKNLSEAQRDLDFMKEMRDLMGGDTMRLEDQVAIRDAERALALTKAAAAAGLATQADVLLAEQKLAIAREEAMTYNEAVAEMEQQVAEANLAVQQAQLGVLGAFLSMLQAAQNAGAGSAEAFEQFALALGMPIEQVNALIALMTQAQEIAGEFPDLTPGSGSSGGTSGPTPPPYVGPPAVGGGGGGLYLQHGGRFAGRQPIIVGEAGPELLVPKTPGMVFSNRDLGRFMGSARTGGTINIGSIPIVVQWPIDGVEQRKIAMQIREVIRQLDGEY